MRTALPPCMERSTRHETYPVPDRAAWAAARFGRGNGRRHCPLLLAAGGGGDGLRRFRSLRPRRRRQRHCAPLRAGRCGHDAGRARRAHAVARRDARIEWCAGACGLYPQRCPCAGARLRVCPAHPHRRHRLPGAILLPLHDALRRRLACPARARQRRMGASRVLPAQGRARH